MKTLKSRLIFTAAALLCLTFTGCSMNASHGDTQRTSEPLEQILPQNAEEPAPDNGQDEDGDKCPECPDNKCPECPDDKCPDGKHGHHWHRGKDHGWRRVKPHPIQPPEDGENEENGIHFRVGERD